MKAQSASLPQLLAWGKTLNQQAKHAYHPWGASLMLETLVVQAQRAYFNLNVQFTRNPL
jgi:hypothetical protein